MEFDISTSDASEPRRRAVGAIAQRLGRTSAQVLHLTGSSPLATSGVEIQGSPVAANGKLSPGSPDPVACPLATCALTLAPHSAALVTLSAG